jgi:Putative papain-like cysteine peptidase (DUF1796)
MRHGKRISNVWQFEDDRVEMNSMNTFISLGSRCQIATQLQRNGMRSALCPFDWLISDDTSGICTSIEKDFVGFFSPQNLRVHSMKKPFVEDVVYQIVDSHSFQTIDAVPKKAQEVYDKYQRAAARFRTAMNSFEHCILLRKYSNPWQIRSIMDLINRKYPKARFTIVSLVDIERDDLQVNEGRIRTFGIHYPPSFAQGDKRFDAEWTQLLQKLANLKYE